MRRAVVLALGCVLALPGSADAGRGQDSTFQDDNLLVYGEAQLQAQTLDTLHALGVDRIRVSLFWKVVAPEPGSEDRPDFDAADPAAYPPGAWDRYDGLLIEARRRGIGVNFDLTGPAPDWATGEPARGDLDDTYEPRAAEFGQFVRAAGRRYDGGVVGADGRPLPRVDYWSIWNEPNQAGWLTPQWVPDPRAPKAWVEASPRLYRDLVDAAFDGLVASGHEQDTILIGETAPKGLKARGVARSMAPGRFIRRLYCLDDALRPLTGSNAELLGCPTDGNAQRFRAAHPALLGRPGWAHHPYELTSSPNRRPADPDWYTIANLDALQRLLRRVRGVWDRTALRRRVPIYLTEFGYQTNPPDPLGVTLGRQAAFLDHAEFLAWREPSVRTHSQFLLVDDQPLPGYPTTSVGAWGTTFQTGLVNLDGSRKPAFASYQLPIHVPQRRVRRGRRLRVWGLARAAPAGTRVEVLVRRRGARGSAFVLAHAASADGRGYVDTRLRVRRSGSVRLRWRSPSGGVAESRAVSFRVR